MSPVATTMYRVNEIVEPFYRYTFVAWSRARTDTPDLLGFFRQMEQEAEGYRAMNHENIAVHADFAAASFRSLPSD